MLIWLHAAQGAGDWEAWSGSASSRVRKAAEDTFYGFTEFFRDLDADLKARRAKRDQQPRSLWEELADIGEEFVEFLEGATRASSYAFAHAQGIACMTDCLLACRYKTIMWTAWASSLAARLWCCSVMPLSQ